MKWHKLTYQTTPRYPFKAHPSTSTFKWETLRTLIPHSRSFSALKQPPSATIPVNYAYHRNFLDALLCVYRHIYIATSTLKKKLHMWAAGFMMITIPNTKLLDIINVCRPYSRYVLFRGSYTQVGRYIFKCFMYLNDKHVSHLENLSWVCVCIFTLMSNIFAFTFFKEKNEKNTHVSM